MRRGVRATAVLVALVLAATALGACDSSDPGSAGAAATPTTAAAARTGKGGSTPTDPRRPYRPPAPLQVTLVGDSMAHEARTALAAAARAKHLDLTMDLLGKAAPCSQSKDVLAALARRPDVVALEWVGNALFTAGCTKAFQPAEVVAEYRAALDRFVAARPAGTTLVLVGIPPIVQYPWSTTWKLLDQLYRDTAARHAGVAYLDVTPQLAPGGTFAHALPCSGKEQAAKLCGTQGAPAGQVVVRDPIGFHFCPVRYDLDSADCPVPSPGAARYADQIVGGIPTLVTRQTQTP